MDKVVKARKKWKCDMCGKPIEIGEKHKYWEAKGPKFDIDGETQIGVEFMKGRLCLDGENVIKITGMTSIKNTK